MQKKFQKNQIKPHWGAIFASAIFGITFLAGIYFIFGLKGGEIFSPSAPSPIQETPTEIPTETPTKIPIVSPSLNTQKAKPTIPNSPTPIPTVTSFLFEIER